jgi:hypothetical protein
MAVRQDSSSRPIACIVWVAQKVTQSSCRREREVLVATESKYQIPSLSVGAF